MTETESVVTQARENGPVVVATDVTRRYGAGDTAVDALRGVSVSVPSGALTAVMGPSGSGKSTLMHILAGLDQPTSGSVKIAGTEITDLGDNDLTRLRREHIGFVFQFFNLLPMLSAEENILLPLSIAGEKPEPDGPITAVSAPFGTLTETPRSASTAVSPAPYRRVTSVATTTGPFSRAWVTTDSVSVTSLPPRQFHAGHSDRSRTPAPYG